MILQSFIKLLFFTVTFVKVFKGKELKACNRPTTLSWAGPEYLDLKGPMTGLVFRAGSVGRASPVLAAEPRRDRATGAPPLCLGEIVLVKFQTPNKQEQDLLMIIYSLSPTGFLQNDVLMRLKTTVFQITWKANQDHVSDLSLRWERMSAIRTDKQDTLTIRSEARANVTGVGGERLPSARCGVSPPSSVHAAPGPESRGPRVGNAVSQRMPRRKRVSLQQLP